jgi:hypothetical protein
VYEEKIKRGIDTSMHHLSVYSENLVGLRVDLDNQDKVVGTF